MTGIEIGQHRKRQAARCIKTEDFAFLFLAGEGGSPVTASCQVANLQTTGGACSFKGTASQTDGLLVPRSYRLAPSNIQLTAPAYAGPGILISGNYADTLTVTVAPAT